MKGSKMKIEDFKLHLKLPKIVCDQIREYKKLGYSKKDVITMALIYYFKHNKIDLV